MLWTDWKKSTTIFFFVIINGGKSIKGIKALSKKLETRYWLESSSHFTDFSPTVHSKAHVYGCWTFNFKILIYGSLGIKNRVVFQISYTHTHTHYGIHDYTLELLIQ